MIHINIKPDVLGYIFGFPITNSVLSSSILLIVFAAFCLYFSRNYDDMKSPVIFFTRFVIRSLYSLFHSVNHEKTDELFAILASFFLFIIFSNLFGLFPGVGSIVVKMEHEAVPLLKGATADLNTTLALAIISFTLIQFYGIKYVGLKGYMSKFFNFSSPMMLFIGLLEFISELSRIVSFSFRLFGNIFAGEVVLLVVAILVPLLASFPFLMFEIFVSFVQALVFAMLTAVFINVATQKAH